MPPARRGLFAEGRSNAPLGNKPVLLCQAANTSAKLCAPAARTAIKPAICKCVLELSNALPGGGAMSTFCSYARSTQSAKSALGKLKQSGSLLKPDVNESKCASVTPDA